MNKKRFTSLVAGAALLALSVACGDGANVNVTTNTNNANANANANATVAANTNTNANAANDNWNWNVNESDFNVNANNWRARAANLGETIGSAASDGWIHFKVRGALATTDDLRDSTINVDVENGVVTLRGSVGSQAKKDQAAKVARVEGVKSVNNRLEVKPDAGIGGNANAGNTNANR